MTEGSRSGQAALVTGGASGIGKATVRRLARDGAAVTIADADGAAIERALSEIGHPAVSGVVMDVTDWAQVEEQTRAAAARMGGLDVLVTSAGVTHPATAWDTRLEDWNRVLAINLTGTFLCVKAVAPPDDPPPARADRHDSITASHVWSGRAAYAASKGGVLALARSCAADLAVHGITVNAVSPGPIATPQTAALHSAAIREKVEGRTPMGRYGTPEEVADFIAFLCSSDARFVTGHELRVDGGWTAG